MSRLAHSLRRMAPASGGGGGSPVGQQVWTTAGSYSFTVPTGVTSICTVCIGSGGGGGTGLGARTGGGGNLSYTNAASVTPGETLTVSVGAAGASSPTSSPTIGNVSYVLRSSTYLCSAASFGSAGNNIGTATFTGAAGGTGTATGGAGQYGANGSTGSGGSVLTGDPSGTHTVGSFGAGGAKSTAGQVGGVRILWGSGRAYPNTFTGDL